MDYFGANLKIYRNALGLSQAEVGQQVDAHQTMIAQIEKGLKNPSMDLALRIAKFFNVTVEDMVSEPTEASVA